MEHADLLRELTSQNHLEEFVPGLVYDNLLKVMTYRGGTLLYPRLEHNTIAQKLNTMQYVSIIGERSSDDLRGDAIIVILLLSPGSKYAARAADAKKLLKEMMPKAERQLEILMVSHEDLVIYVKKAIRAQSESRIDIATYAIFKEDPFNHVSVGKHYLAGPAEVKLFTSRYQESTANFPVIITSDPIAIWLGIRAGHIVKVVRLSESAGEIVELKQCVRGAKLVDKFKKDGDSGDNIVEDVD